MPFPRPLLLVLFVAALGAAFWRAPAPAPTGFTPPAKALAALPASFVGEMLWRDTSAVATAPSLSELPDGRIAAVWLAGTDDAMTVRLNVRDRDGWRQPLQIASRESTAGGTFARIGQLASPVIYAEGSWLHLWYGSSALGDSINHSVSTDGGKTWTQPARLTTSPFANFGGQLRSPPLPLADGGLGLSIGHDFIGRHGEWLRLSATGRIIDKRRLSGTGGSAHPTSAVLDEQRAVTVLTAADAMPAPIRIATTADAGAHWQATEAPAITTPATPLAVLRLGSGRLLLAGNPATGRQSLLLWLSADEGKTWREARTVDTAADGGADYTHPALLLGRDGRIHLAYAWRQQGIKYVAFSEAWLDGGQP
ncbi:MAG: hypothetical protein H6R14_1006 [Proteobacteria bacterium]|nr:hypothetical protein [Pseudomonadota bacterium]